MEIVAEELMVEQIRLSNVRWRLATKGRAVCREDVGPLLGLQSMTKPKGSIGTLSGRYDQGARAASSI